MRVLLAAPTSNLKDYCVDRWIKMVRNLTYPNLDILVIDNSKDKKYYHKLLKAGILSFHVEPNGHPPTFITKCQNIIRQYFLEGNYDFLFSLETDVFVQKNIIEYLISYRAPVINVSYLVTQNGGDKLCVQGATKLGKANRLKLLNYSEGFDMYDGNIKEINSYNIGEDFKATGTGIGCTLIRNDVMQQIAFRVDEKKGLSVFSDSYFHLDLQKHYISDIIDTTFTVEHNRQDWRKLTFN